LLAGTVTCGVALALSFSRGGLLSALVGMLTLAFVRSPKVGIAVSIAFITIGALTYPLFLEARLEQTFGAASPNAYVEAAESEESRLAAMAGGMGLWSAAPIFGVGFGRFEALIPLFNPGSGLTYPHNWYIRVLAEQGVVGAIVVAVTAIALLLALVRSREPLRATALAMAFATLTFNLFGDPLLGLQSTGILWVVCAAALTPQAARSRLGGPALVRPTPAGPDGWPRRHIRPVGPGAVP
jgi:O-antigen ligase